MKIYTRLVTDIASGEILEEESFEYEGKVSWCGGSGSGGSQSGDVDYPKYMKDIHRNWLSGEQLKYSTTLLSGEDDYKWEQSGSDSDEYYLLSNDGTDPYVSKPDAIVIDGSYSSGEGTVGSLSAGEWGFGDNDSIGFDTIYLRTSSSDDPDSHEVSAEHQGAVEISDPNSITGLLHSRTGSSPYSGRSAYNPDSRISSMDSEVTDFENRIDNLTTTDAVEQQIAQFDAAMRDINAVNTSNFVIGRAIIASGFIETKLEAKNNLANLKVDTNRIAMTSKSEQTDTDRKIDVKDALWDMQIYQLGGNIMASIGGGTISGSEEEGVSETRSAIGGALSGAAAGASIGTKAAKGTSYEGQGGAYGAGIGAAVGIAAALYSS